MKRTILTTNLTKAYIESKVSQEQIVSTYLNIPIETVKECIDRNILIESVFRNDDFNKSMGIQYNNKGRLKVRDFGGFGFFEDVYGVVAYILSIAYNRRIETNSKQDFYFILKHIALTFSDLIDGKEVDPNIIISINRAANACRNQRPIIEVAPRSWNRDDKILWEKWGISLGYLNTHFVVPVQQYYINRAADTEPKYNYRKADPCYAYILGQSKGITYIKLYFPERDRNKKTKFITNCNVLEGLLNLELDNYDYILITKSSKDRLSIGNHLSSHSFYGGAGVQPNIGIINLPSENYQLRENEYNFLISRLNENGKIISLLDFDKTGRHGAKYLKETYDIPYIFITRGEFGLENYACKDFADLHDKYSINEINNFIQSTITYAELKYGKLKGYSDAYPQGLFCD